MQPLFFSGLAAGLGTVGSSYFSSRVSLCLLSSVQVSLTVAQAQSVSMAMLFVPLTTRKKPDSPNCVPHEFLTVQYLVPSSTP